MERKVKSKEALLELFERGDAYMESDGGYESADGVFVFTNEMFNFCGESLDFIRDSALYDDYDFLGGGFYWVDAWLEPITEVVGENSTSFENIQERIHAVNDLAADFLIGKNIKYGNSAMEPIGIFGKHVKPDTPALNGILIRIDDKLQRIKNSSELRSNDVIDLFGYIELAIIAKDWDNKETFDKHKE